jgi:HEAT repeat protein
MWSLFVRFGRGPTACLVLLSAVAAWGQNDVKQRAKAVREMAKGGPNAIAQIAPYLKDGDASVRQEAVKAIADLGTQQSLEPLLQALNDNDAEVQIRATDGLVNFYLPGYVKMGVTAPLKRAGTALKGRFTDTNDQVIDAYVRVRPDVIAALGRLVRSGSDMDARANAARAIGILRGRAAVPDLVSALHSKNTQVIYESLVALQKIRDTSAGPQIAFLLHDLDAKVQITTLETLGLLQDHSSVNDIRDVLDRSHDSKVRRSALGAVAMMPDDNTRGVFLAYLNDKDDNMRAAAAEGLGRLGIAGDLAALQKAYEGENKSKPKLADAFALVNMGQAGTGEDSPLHFLVSEFDSRGFRGVALGYLIELARKPATRQALYAYLRPEATKDEKIQIGQVLAASGDRDSIPYLETLSRDTDSEVAQEGLRSLRILRARIG